jgi:hypothetical protein
MNFEFCFCFPFSFNFVLLSFVLYFYYATTQFVDRVFSAILVLLCVLYDILYFICYIIYAIRCKSCAIKKLKLKFLFLISVQYVLFGLRHFQSLDSKTLQSYFTSINVIHVYSTWRETESLEEVALYTKDKGLTMFDDHLYKNVFRNFGNRLLRVVSLPVNSYISWKIYQSCFFQVRCSYR